MCQLLSVEETICFFSNAVLSVEASSHFEQLLHARLLFGLWARDLVLAAFVRRAIAGQLRMPLKTSRLWMRRALKRY